MPKGNSLVIKFTPQQKKDVNKFYDSAKQCGICPSEVTGPAYMVGQPFSEKNEKSGTMPIVKLCQSCGDVLSSWITATKEAGMSKMQLDARKKSGWTVDA